MGMPVVTKASGGLPVTVVAAGKLALPVSEAANGMGTAVTQVPVFGLPVVYAVPAVTKHDR